MESEGEDLIITARDFGDIHKLMNMYDIDFISVGKHGVSLYDKLKESTSRFENGGAASKRASIRNLSRWQAH